MKTETSFSSYDCRECQKLYGRVANVKTLLKKSSLILIYRLWETLKSTWRRFFGVMWTKLSFLAFRLNAMFVRHQILHITTNTHPHHKAWWWHYHDAEIVLRRKVCKGRGQNKYTEVSWTEPDAVCKKTTTMEKTCFSPRQWREANRQKHTETFQRQGTIQLKICSWTWKGLSTCDLCANWQNLSIFLKKNGVNLSCPDVQD